MEWQLDNGQPATDWTVVGTGTSAGVSVTPSMDAGQEEMTRKLRPKSRGPYGAECAAMSPILDVQVTNPWDPL